jgi:hypothetical protein
MLTANSFFHIGEVIFWPQIVFGLAISRLHKYFVREQLKTTMPVYLLPSRSALLH